MKNLFQNSKLKFQYPVSAGFLHFVSSLFSILLCLLLAASSVRAEAAPLPVFNAEGKEIGSLEVLEIEEAEYVLLREVSRLFSGIRKSKLLIRQETVIIRGKEIILTLGRHRLRVDGEEYVLTNPPTSISDEAAVPVEFLTEILPNVTGRKITLDREDWALQLSDEPFVREDGDEVDSNAVPDLESGKFRVIIDPGHGGYDSGAKSKDGLLEKELTLRIARKMKESLARQEGVEVYLTRSRDDYLTLEERVNRANTLRGHVYLSIHLNWSPSSRSSGFRTYVNSNRIRLREADMPSWTDPATGRLSESKGLLSQSKRLAKEIAHGLESVRLTGKQVNEVPLAFMDNLSMPGILVEVLYLSSLHDLRMLSMPGFIDSVSQSLCDSILNFRSFSGR